MVLLEAVRDQYREFPYPARDPQDERRRLIQDLPSQVALVNHLLWGGHRPLDGLRVLDAGCGTGDSTICIGEQLRGSGARVTALDFSAASLAIAAERARVRGFDHVAFVEGTIETLPALGLGPFDYVICSGVLHHLASPEAGLQALARVLAPDGGLCVMVYGRYGRTAIYHLQELMRLAAPPQWPAERRLRVAKRLLSRLGPNHPGTLYAPSWKREVDENGDAGIYDMFLHTQDRPYTVPEIHAWLEGAGLALLGFDFPVGYEPRTWNAEIDTAHLALPQRQALAELLHGHMGNHTFFAAHAAYTPPAPPPAEDESAIPLWSYYDPAGDRDRALSEGKALVVRAGTYTLTMPLTAISRALLRRVDGRAPLGAILNATATAFPAATRRQLRDEWLRVYGQLNGVRYLVLNAAA